MVAFDPLMVQQIPEEYKHFLNPMSMALMAMKIPTGKLAWRRLRALKKYQSTTALRA